MNGSFWEGKYLPLHTEVGLLSDDHGSTWRAVLGDGMTPMIISGQTKKIWVLKWEKIIELAIKDGIEIE